MPKVFGPAKLIAHREMGGTDRDGKKPFVPPDLSGQGETFGLLELRGLEDYWPS